MRHAKEYSLIDLARLESGDTIILLRIKLVCNLTLGGTAGWEGFTKGKLEKADKG